MSEFLEGIYYYWLLLLDTIQYGRKPLFYVNDDVAVYVRPRTVTLTSMFPNSVGRANMRIVHSINKYEIYVNKAFLTLENNIKDVIIYFNEYVYKVYNDNKDEGMDEHIFDSIHFLKNADIYSALHTSKESVISYLNYLKDHKDLKRMYGYNEFKNELNIRIRNLEEQNIS
jgi:hypothetical protein